MKCGFKRIEDQIEEELDESLNALNEIQEHETYLEKYMGD